MEEFRIKIGGAQKAQIEVVPTSDGGVEIVVHYGEGSAKTYGSYQNKPKGKYKSESLQKSSEDIIEEMKASAREEYLKPNSDKEEIKKFVKFWEKKITENGWNGSSFKFSTLYEKWLSNKK